MLSGPGELCPPVLSKITTVSMMVAVIAAASGCPRAAVEPVETVRMPVRTEAYSRLLKRIDGEARQGALVVGPESLQLRIRRGEETVSFLEVPRQTFEAGCFRAPDFPGPSYMRVDEASGWWLFSNDTDALAGSRNRPRSLC